jgi:hypothetical protein
MTLCWRYRQAEYRFKSITWLWFSTAEQGGGVLPGVVHKIWGKRCG